MKGFTADRPALAFLLLGAILLAAALLRFPGLGAAPIWLDEGYSIWFSDQSWRYLWQEVPRFENHPPLYYMALKGWRGLAGSSEFALRFPSALASMGVVLLLFVSGRIVGRLAESGQGASGQGWSGQGWTMGLLAASLGAFAELQLFFAAEARPYAIGALGVSLMMAGALQAMCGRGPAPAAILGEGWRSPLGLAGLSLGMSLTIWSHALGLVPAGLAALFLVGWWLLAKKGDLQVFLRLAAAAALVLLLCWAQFRNLLAQLSWDYTEFWIAPPGLSGLARLSVAAAGLPGLPGGLLLAMPVTGALLAMGLAGLWTIGRGDRRALVAALFLLCLSAGYGLVLLLYTYLAQPVMLYRTMIFMQPPCLMILAAAPWALPRMRPLLGAGLVALAALAAAGPAAIPEPGRSYRSIVQTIVEGGAEEAAVEGVGEGTDAPVLALRDTQLVLDYYGTSLGADLRIRPVPAPFPRLRLGLGIEELTPEAAAALVEDLGQAQIVWLVSRGSATAQSLQSLQQALRDSGRRESVLLGGIGGGDDAREILIRYRSN